MKLRYSIAVCIAATGGIADASTHRDPAALATPPGITIKVAALRGPDNQNREHLLFADAKGWTLYVSQNDKPLKSTCAGTCATEWVPLQAPTPHLRVGDWQSFSRADGLTQWAFQERPVYTYANEGKDSVPQTPRVPDAYDKRLGAPSTVLRSTSGHNVKGHAFIEVSAGTWQLPVGVRIQEVRAAHGHVLTNSKGMTLYVFDGVADTVSTPEWIPFRAPFIARPTKQFGLANRSDGIHQWTFQGKPLFAFAGDSRGGDARGSSVNAKFRPAYVLPYFVPANVAVRPNSHYGGLLVTGGNQTLYTREIRHDGADDGILGDRGDLVTGTRIGLQGCDDECEKTFQPFLAPEDAQACGYWSVYQRKDGKKQWAYFGYALYTYVKDRPGQTTGNLVYEPSRDAGRATQGQQQIDMGLRWRVLPP